MGPHGLKRPAGTEVIEVQCRFFALAVGALAGVAAAGCREASTGPDGPLGVAEVNGVPIRFEQLARELAFARRTSAGLVPQSEEEKQAFRLAVLQDLVDRMLVLDAARRAGITVPPEKVERELLKLKAEYHGAAFNEALAEGQLTPQELRERTRDRLVMERYFVEQVFSRVVVTDPEIEAWYEENREEMAQADQVRAAQIVVKTLQEARQVQAELRKGMTFDEAARRFSLSPDAKVGGDLGYFSRGVMPPVFDQVCFTLPTGRISDVVASEYGFHLFKVLDRRPAEQRSLDQVRPEIEARLLQARRAEAQKKAVEELRARAQIRIDEEALARLPL